MSWYEGKAVVRGRHTVVYCDEKPDITMTNRFQHRISDPALQIDALDGVRGVAVLLVLLGHLSTSDMHVIPGIDFSGAGKTGVWLFFTLSAFLLTRSILKHSEEAADGAFWANYFIRRFLRIYPLFSFVLALSYLCSTFLRTGIPFSISANELVQHLTLRAGKNVLWSIPPEVIYYLLLPFVALLFIAAKKRLLPALAIISAGIVVSSNLWPAALATGNSFILGPYVPIFLLGSFTALLHSLLTMRLNSAGKGRFFFEGAAWSMLIVIFATIPSVYSRLSGHQVAYDHFHGDLLFFGFIWSIFLLSVLLGAGFCGNLLSSRPLRYLGSISFSVYLWHMSVIDVLASNSPFRPAVTGWFALIVSVIVASITYFAIERPCMNIVIWKIKK